MAAFLIVEIDVADQVEFEEYKRMVASTIAAYGGTYLVRGGAVETLEGDWSPERLVIVKFESKGRARQWWESAEYAEAKKLRQRIASTRMILVEGAADIQ
jgi:uncharacterized protein (DUF1330 family)